MPLNLSDPASGLDYFTAIRQLLDAPRRIGGDVTRASAGFAYWENLFPDAAGGGLTATQAMAEPSRATRPTTSPRCGLADQFCDPACSRFGPFAYFAEQYHSLAARSSIGRSSTTRCSSRCASVSAGLQFDFNYTLAQAKDHGSEVERGSGFGNFGSGGYSGFLDQHVRSRISTTRTRTTTSGISSTSTTSSSCRSASGKGSAGMPARVVNAIVGDWSVAGIVRWTSGFPFNVINCRQCWATNWNLQGNAELVIPGELPVTEQTKNAVDGRPSPFADPQAALESFRFHIRARRASATCSAATATSRSTPPQQRFRMPSDHRLRFRWDVFNVTNTPRFDTGDIDVLPDRAASFGRYNGIARRLRWRAGRCMQLNLKYLF